MHKCYGSFGIGRQYRVTKKFNATASQIEVEHLNTTDQLLDTILKLTSFKINVKEFEEGHIVLELKK